jgi:hypothetical protein
MTGQADCKRDVQCWAHCGYVAGQKLLQPGTIATANEVTFKNELAERKSLSRNFTCCKRLQCIRRC